MALPFVKYPIGIQSFESIRREDFIYVDKTDLIYNLVHTSKCVFLSRPRRFGKSLLLSTMQAYFEGKKELFKGLAMEKLESEWKKYPVLTLSLAQFDPNQEDDLQNLLEGHFRKWEREYDIKEIDPKISIRFRNIIEAIYHTTGQKVVVLIDEYDSPLVASMDNSQRQDSHRTLLKSVYTNLKDLNEYIRFTMLTGVSRFSRMTVFSGLNNLEDISLDDAYASICGITEEELLRNFTEGIAGIAKKYSIEKDDAVKLLKDNYDGYHFSEDCPDIYNPFSLLNAMKKQKIGAYWFQTGTPEFLVHRIREGNEFLPEFFTENVEENLLSSSEFSETEPVSLLYQTGYLTIKEYDRPLYRLGIPNLEVREGLFNNLARYYLKEKQTVIFKYVSRVRQLLEAGDVDQAMERLKTFMAGIPYEFADKAPELHYENNFFIVFVLIGVDARPEWHTSDGRIDMLLKMRNYIYVVELKLDKAPEEALGQIEKKDYARQFQADPRPVIRLGVTISTETRNISEWSVERE